METGTRNIIIRARQTGKTEDCVNEFIVRRTCGQAPLMVVINETMRRIVADRMSFTGLGGSVMDSIVTAKAFGTSSLRQRPQHVIFDEYLFYTLPERRTIFEIMCGERMRSFGASTGYTVRTTSDMLYNEDVVTSLRSMFKNETDFNKTLGILDCALGVSEYFSLLIDPEANIIAPNKQVLKSLPPKCRKTQYFGQLFC